MSQTFRAFITGALILGLGFPSQAQELIRFVSAQPPERVRETCAHVEIWQWGCVVLLPATDNAEDVWCLMVIPADPLRMPWDEEALLAPLRLQCLEEGSGR